MELQIIKFSLKVIFKFDLLYGILGCKKMGICKFTYFVASLQVNANLHIST